MLDNGYFINVNEDINLELSGKKQTCKTKIPVTKEEFEEYYRPIDTFRKRQQFHGRCSCPLRLSLTCNMDCATCQFAVAGDMVSLNEAIDDEDGNEIEYIDMIPSDEQDCTEKLAKKELMQELHKQLAKLSPAYKKICLKIMEGKTEREIAAEMKTSQASVHRQKIAAFEILRKGLKRYI